MNNTKINSAFLGYVGFFRYDKQLLRKKQWESAYTPMSFFKDSQEYLQQKYYTNWLHSMFYCFKEQENHLELNSIELEKLNESLTDKKGIFKINKVEVLLFPKGFGLFIIKTNVNEDFLQWDIIANTANTTRKLLSSTGYTLSVKWVEEYITPYFCKDISAWRQSNAQLKTVTLVDIDKQPNTTEMDNYLFAMGSHTPPNNNEETLYIASEQYAGKKIDDVAISVFHNWKALCLHDSLTRISVNLDEKDTFKLWQNEYLYLYVNVLFNRFFLQYTNDKLVDFTKNFRSLIKSRDLFFVLISKYNHYKLSYKFLPNLLYSKFSEAMDIQKEIDTVDNKIERLNALNQEKNDKKTQKILAVLTVLSTFFAFAKDGKSMFEIKADNLILFLGVILVLALIFVLFLFVDKNSNNFD